MKGEVVSLLQTSLGYTIQLVRKFGVKRLSLRFSLKKKVFVCTAPYLVSKADIHAFLLISEPWLEKVAKKCAESRFVFEEGAALPFLGQDYRIVFREAAKPFAHINNAEEIIEIFAPSPEHIETLAKQLLKRIAFEKVKAYSELYANTIQKTIAKITMKEMTSRYGSCSAKGNLNFHWRLVLAPEFVLSYVCAHEVAHLAEMNHSRAFWKIVASLDPRYKEAKRWLKAYGATLF